MQAFRPASLWKDSPVQVLSCEYCKIKNILLYFLLYLLNKMPYLLESCGNTFILIWLESFCSFDSYITLEKSIYYATFYLGCFHSVTRASWFSGHRFKLETQNFIFHILHRNFPNFGMKILVLCSAKSLQSFSFFFFCFLIQSLFKTFPKLIYVFLFLFLSDI